MAVVDSSEPTVFAVALMTEAVKLSYTALLEIGLVDVELKVVSAVGIFIPPEPVNISNSVNKEEPQEETKGGGTTRLWQAFAIIAFIIAGGIGKALGKEAYKHFPFIFGMITGSIIVSLIPYFLVKKYGKWDNNDTMSWIFATVCFVAHMVAGLFFSVPLVLVMAFIIYIKHK